jgi:hypothetical protein
MKQLVGIAALVTIALVLRFWLHTGLGLGITIHDTYRVVSLKAIVFWCLMGTASAWFLISRGKLVAHRTDLGEEQ